MTYRLWIGGTDKSTRFSLLTVQGIVQSLLAISLVHEPIEGESGINFRDSEVLLAVFIIFYEKVWPP
jgi:hypothetical protein